MFLDVKSFSQFVHLFVSFIWLYLFYWSHISHFLGRESDQKVDAGIRKHSRPQRSNKKTIAKEKQKHDGFIERKQRRTHTTSKKKWYFLVFFFILLCFKILMFCSYLSPDFLHKVTILNNDFTLLFISFAK